MARVCRKIKYTSQIAANAAILSFWKRRMHDANRFPVRSYYCEECRAWHITSMPKTPD